MSTIQALALAHAILGGGEPEESPTFTDVEMTARRHAEEVDAYSRTVTAQFRSFAEVERRQRIVFGALRVGAGAILISVGVTLFIVKRGTTAEGSGMGILGAGGVSLGGGVFGLAFKGPAQTFVESGAFDHGAQEGWSMEMLEMIKRETAEKARKARRRRLAVGSVSVIGGTAAAVTVSTLLGLELQTSEPDGVLAGSYAQGLASSLGIVVTGIVGLATPTIIEVVARNLRRN